MKRYAFRKWEKDDQSLVIRATPPVPPYSDIGIFHRETKAEKWQFRPSRIAMSIDIETMAKLLAFMEAGK